MGKINMQYPEHLIPKSTYKYINDLEELRLCTLVRHTKDHTIYLEGTNQLNPEVLKLEVTSSQLRDLSTNLLGVFTLNDIFINIINNELLELWVEGEDLQQPISHEQDFRLVDGRGYFYFRISEVIDLEIPGGIKGVPVNFNVLHTPIKANFWHFSIRVFSEGVEMSQLPISDNKRTKIWKGIKDFLTVCAFVDSNDHTIIPERCYCE